MLRRKLRGRVESLAVTSAALKGNALGDPHERELLVYTPPSYDGARRFPVVYVLPAYPSTGRSLHSDDVWKPSVVEILDGLIAEGRAAEAILVLVDGSTSFGGSQYLDSPAVGRYQTYLAEDVLPAVDAAYRTVAEAAGRAIAGRSSGGFGALRFAMDRPGIVSAVASHAGDMGFEVSVRPMFAPAAMAFAKAGGLAAFAERVREGGPRSGSEYDAVFFLAAAAAYAPDMALPFPHAALPFDLRTLELDLEIWARWSAQDPVVRLAAPAAVDALRALRLLYLDAGTQDEYALQFGARAFVRAAESRGARVTYEEFDGGHRGTGHRFERSFELLLPPPSPAQSPAK